MKMFIGGSFQGKKAVACEQTGIALDQACDGMTCEEGEVFEAPMVVHFHEYCKRMMAEGKDTSGLAKALMEKNPDLVIVTNEIGYGVVPMDAFDRRYREDTSRICCELAAFSSEVWRVCCGIGTCIKG